ncbi:MAG: hypothetical protein R3Y61_03015 [Rikenellaceae bacterium]
MKKSLLLAAAVGFAMFGCSKSPVDNVEVEGLKTISLTVSASDEADTRVSITPDENNSIWTVQWSAGDCIGVFSEVMDEFAMSSFTDPTGQNATFTGTTSASAGRLVYPYNPSAVSGNILTVDLSSQDCDMKNDFSVLGSSINMISSDIVSLEDAVNPNLKHIGAALQIKTTFSDLDADAEYYIESIELSNVPSVASVNLLSAITATDFMTTSEGTMTINVSNSGALVNAETYVTNVAILPFTLASGDALSVKYTLKSSAEGSNTSRIEKTCTVTNSTGAEADFARALHHTINVDCSVADATVTNATTTLGFFGSGSSSDPYQITSAADLRNLATYVFNNTAFSSYFILTNDIDLGCSEDNVWFPIGSANTGGNKFKSKFDGQGHTITGFYIDNPNLSEYAGLFGVCINGAEITNLNLEGTVKSTASACASFIGRMNNTGCLLENCSFTGELINDGVKDASGSVSGLVGSIAISTSYVKNCYVNITCTQGTAVSGITNDHRGTIENCVVEGTITGAVGPVGGIAQSCYSGITLNTINKINITATGDNIGGFIGLVKGTSYVVNCVNYGDIDSGTNHAGGIIGSATSTAAPESDGMIQNCVNYGTITTPTSANCSPIFAGTAEGVVGSNCYYLAGTAVGGTDQVVDYTTSMTADELATVEFITSLNAYAEDYNAAPFDASGSSLVGWNLAGDFPLPIYGTTPEGIVVTTTQTLWTSVASPNFGGGLGTEASPYVIASAEELAHLAVICESDSQAGVYFTLSTNIDLSGKVWVSIEGFAGNFSYNGYTIQNATSAVFAL